MAPVKLLLTGQHCSLLFLQGAPQEEEGSWYLTSMGGGPVTAEVRMNGALCPLPLSSQPPSSAERQTRVEISDDGDEVLRGRPVAW